MEQCCSKCLRKEEVVVLGRKCACVLGMGGFREVLGAPFTAEPGLVLVLKTGPARKSV
jgi:hypothetical protein